MLSFRTKREILYIEIVSEKDFSLVPSLDDRLYAFEILTSHFEFNITYT